MCAECKVGVLKLMRADQLLVQRGLAASRSQAQRLLTAGARWLAPTGWKPLGKGDDIPPDAQLELLDAAEARYVSRGGLKLEGALAATGLDVRGLHCLDVGQSTGGFTDCLLAHGAAHVTGVDVGHRQLHPRLAQDARVTAIERVNARHLDAAVFAAAGVGHADVGAGAVQAGTGPAVAEALAPNAPTDAMHTADGARPATTPHAPGAAAVVFDLIVGDLSFISLTLVLPALVPLLAERGHLLMLVKPQFELQPVQIGKGGIVRDAALYAQIEQRLRAACTSCGLAVQQWLPSPIAGGDGNREFFIHAIKDAAAHQV